MKHLITCLALGITCAAGAQTGLVEFPYNPDADNDDLIGVNDLMALLAVFGNEFSEEGLYLSNDSLAALYHTGQMHFQQCFQSCVELPGNWHLPSAEEMWGHDLANLQSGNTAWISMKLDGFYPHNDIGEFRYIYVGFEEGSSQNGRISYQSYSLNAQCYCATHERPKVEYSYCEGTEIQSCADAKVADGWYPLGGPSTMSYNGWHKTQAFWRWAE